MKVNDVKKYIDLSEFPSIYQEFLKSQKVDTLKLEREGKELKDIDGDKAVIDFIKRVFKWGGQLVIAYEGYWINIKRKII